MTPCISQRAGTLIMVRGGGRCHKLWPHIKCNIWVKLLKLSMSFQTLHLRHVAEDKDQSGDGIWVSARHSIMLVIFCIVHRLLVMSLSSSLFIRFFMSFAQVKAKLHWLHLFDLRFEVINCGDRIYAPASFGSHLKLSKGHHINNCRFLDAIASPSTYPCQWVGQWVGQWYRVFF